jgi:hypothetical protein
MQFDFGRSVILLAVLRAAVPWFLCTVFSLLAMHMVIYDMRDANPGDIFLLAKRQNSSPVSELQREVRARGTMMCHNLVDLPQFKFHRRASTQITGLACITRE